MWGVAKLFERSHCCFIIFHGLLTHKGVMLITINLKSCAFQPGVIVLAFNSNAQSKNTQVHVHRLPCYCYSETWIQTFLHIVKNRNQGIFWSFTQTNQVIHWNYKLIAWIFVLDQVVVKWKPPTSWMCVFFNFVGTKFRILKLILQCLVAGICWVLGKL